MRTMLILLLLASPAWADVESDARARAAAAYAASLRNPVTTEPPAFADTSPPPGMEGFGYAEAYAASVRAKCPLVIFVGMGSDKARSFHNHGANTLVTGRLEGVTGSGIVVGVWHGGDFFRYDLPSTATDKEISAALHSGPPSGYPCAPPVVKNPPVATHEQAVKNYLSQSRNVGRCECGATGQGCHCKPASSCGREPCSLHNPLLNPNLVAPVPQLKFALPQDCPTGQ